MHVLFVHQNYPAQFGHIAAWLIREHGWQCTFVSELKDAEIAGIRRIQYSPTGGAREETHYLARSFENATAHAHGVYEACKLRIQRAPDLVVAHSGFGSSVFLADLWPGVPIVNYCEFYHHTRGSDMDFRPEFPPSDLNFLRARARNAMLLLDLQTCTAACSPTQWQRSRFPAEYQRKIEVIFDGIDRAFWRRNLFARRIAAGRDIPDGMRVVTYVARGFESMRGFDIFMKVAAQICAVRQDVIFVVVGEDRVCYGGDESYLGGRGFKDYVLSRGNYDLARFVFTGRISPKELAELFSISDLHIYLTVPFVLSWSMMNALSCGCTVLASDTEPVREMIRQGENGLLAGFFDVDELTRKALSVLETPEEHRAHLGGAAEEFIERGYSLSQTMPRMLNFLSATADLA